MYYKSVYDSKIGQLTLACDNKENLIGLWLEGQKYFGDTTKNIQGTEIIENGSLEIFKKAKNWLDRYFGGDKPGALELQLAPVGNGFRQRVWQMLCEIPYGEVITYGDIARKIAHERGKDRMSAQAVGNAVGHNPISIIIPCHRVVAANGSLTGYAGGIETKVKLLEFENIGVEHRTSGFFVSKVNNFAFSGKF